MSLIRKNIRLLSILIIYFQIGIIFSSIVHNHGWHYLKIYQNIFFDNYDENSHTDPYADESGLCRINDYVRNNFSVANSPQIDLTFLNGLSFSLLFTTNNAYQSFTDCCKFLRSPPFA